MVELFTTEALIALFTLTAMEIVLGIDNIVFIAIVVSRLPKEMQARARRLGIGLALISRLALLFSISWLMKLTEPWLSVGVWSFSGKDLILIFGGLFLIGKATFEIHHKVEGDLEGDLETQTRKNRATFAGVILQIIFLDVIFSLDSVITAVGMTSQIWVMVVAIVIAVLVMLISAGHISDFVNRHPTIKILALSFLILIGVMLLMDGMGKHMDRAYLYFAMGFSLVVELLNMRYRVKHEPTQTGKKS